jgi:hypothetical protein
MKVQELLTDESKWCQEALALDKNNNIVWSRSDEAVCWCLQGGIDRCYPGDNRDIFEKIKKATGGIPVDRWNDNPERKFSDVRNLVVELNI